MRLGLTFILCALTLSGLRAEQGQIDTNISLFSVLSALNAAGYDADLSSPYNSALRLAVRQELAKQNIPVLPELRAFVAAHRKDDPAQELGQYVSFALATSGPPLFTSRFGDKGDPPDVAALGGLGPLMARFYREAAIDQLWAAAQPALQQAVAQHQVVAIRSLTAVNGYLRNPTSGYLGRKFTILVEQLAAPHQVNLRTYEDDMYLVLSPTVEVPAEEIRHAYLRYLVEPLTYKFSKNFDRLRGMRDYAEGAPLLPAAYKAEFGMLAGESLVKAIEARLLPAGKRDLAVAEAMKQGFVLTAAFYEQLPAYEQQEQALRLYLPDLLAKVDLRAEAQRFAKFEFASERPAKVVAPARLPTADDTIAGEMAAAEQLYEAGQWNDARERWLQLLKRPDSGASHAQAYYGLARIALKSRPPELDEAERLFSRAVELRPTPLVHAWSLIYLGRLADAQTDGREQAVKYYQAALQVEGASEAARKAAQAGLQKATRAPQQ